MGVQADGVWHLEDDETIGPSTTAAVLDAMGVRAKGSVHIYPGGSVFSGRITIEGRPAFLSLRFLGERLELLEIVLLPGSELFTRDGEERLKLEHDAWLRGLGVVLAPLTYTVGGVDVLPDRPGLTHPSRAVCPWGEVTSMIEPRNGGAIIVARYAHA